MTSVAHCSSQDEVEDDFEEGDAFLDLTGAKELPIKEV